MPTKEKHEKTVPHKRYYWNSRPTTWLDSKMQTLRLVGASQEEMEAVGRIYQTCTNLLGHCDNDIADEMYTDWFRENIHTCTRNGQSSWEE